MLDDVGRNASVSGDGSNGFIRDKRPRFDVVSRSDNAGVVQVVDTDFRYRG